MTGKEGKTFVWGIAIGAVVMVIFLFASGWAVTRGTAKAKAEEMARNAVIEQLVPVCIQQSLQDPNREEIIKKIDEESYWRRGDIVEKAGWATMPGAEEPVYGVADECAKQLLIESKK